MHLPPSGSPDPAPGRAVRRADPATVLADLVGALARGDDVLGLFEEMTARCAELFDAAAGLLLADGRNVLHVVAASSAEVHDLEVLEALGTRGPCEDCWLTGEQVLVGDLAGHVHRWPSLVPAVLAGGSRSISAVPVRLGSRTLGVLVLLSRTTTALGERDLSLAQALADISGVALNQRIREHDASAQVQTVLDDRVVLEQAKGFLAQSGRLDMTQALEALRRFALDRDLDLPSVARALVTRALPASAVLGNDDERT